LETWSNIRKTKDTPLLREIGYTATASVTAIGKYWATFGE